MARSKSISRSPTRSSSTSEALAEFHSGHAGAVDACEDCASAQRHQRQAAAALRAHCRQARQQAAAILGKAVSS